MAIDIAQALTVPIDLKSGLIQQAMRSQLMKGDKKANRVIVELTDGGKTVDLAGVTVTGSFIRPPDGAEISLVGRAEGNKAIIELDDACYAQDGYCEIDVALTIGSVRRTVVSLTGYVLTKGSGAYVDVSGVIPNLDDVIAQYAEMQRVTQETQAAASSANTAATNANTKAAAAQTAASSANNAASAANTAAAKIDGMTVSAEDAGAAGAVISEKNGVKHIAFKIPKGDTGATPEISFEVETGAAGTNVKVEQSGTPEAPHIKLTIPRGDTGAVEGVDYYEGEPAALGVASPGTANGVARGNHVHPMPSAEDVGARPNTWTPSAEDVGALGKTEQAADSAKLGGKAPEYYLHAIKLTDNSDFSNPVNQSGITTFAPGTTVTYFIDRWYSARTALAVTSSGLSFAWDGTNGTDGWIQQRIPNGSRFYGKTLTTAIEFSDGSKIVASGTVPTETNKTTYFYNRDEKGITLAYTNMSNSDVFSLVVNINKSNGVIIKNIAVYDGVYTAENVPPYVRKESELAECYRYQYIPQNELRFPAVAATAKSLYFFVPVPQEMRANPSLSKDPEVWKLSTNTKQTGWSFTCSKRINANYVQIVATKETNDLGTDAVLSLGNVITSSNPAFIFDANFY